MDPIHISEETQVPSSPIPLLSAPKRHLVRWIVMLVLVVIVFALLYVFRGMFVVALIDGTPISRLAVVRELERQSGAQALDALVNQTLVEKKAAEKGIIITGEEIEQALSDIRANLSAQNMTLEDALKAENVTLEQVHKTIRLQKLTERILEDQLIVSEEEISAYIEQKKMVQDMLRQQRFASAFSAWLGATKTEVNISYWKEY